MPARNHIELVEKTMRVLEALAETEHGATLGELAARVGLVKSSLFRILFTLQELGYVERAEAGVYRLSLKVLSLGRRPSSRANLISVARPHLVRLRDELGESVWLAQWRGGHARMVDLVDSRHPLRLALVVGDDCWVHATALGKAIAAWLPAEDLAAALNACAFEHLTARTITDRPTLEAELAQVRRCGYAINDEESIEGVIMFAAPVFDATGAVIAAISSGCPVSRSGGAKREAMAVSVRASAARITADLAHVEIR